MGTVVSIQEYRTRRETTAAVGRLDLAVRKLDPLVRHRIGRLGDRVERELIAIAREFSAGRPTDAAERAERLAGLLEHPAVSG